MSAVDSSEALAASAATIERPLGPSAIPKLNGWQLFEKMGRPKFVVAPMVDQSELAWRMLSRLHGSSIAYTPMIHSGLFSPEGNTKYRTEQFDLLSGEEGHTTLDRPLVAQFCSNNKDTFLKAATVLAESGQVDAVDLNLGCPQGIAKRGGYGAFLMEDWTLISSMIHHLHTYLPVPITAKFRVYDSLEKTLDYARMLESSGAQILTIHGRTREQKGQLTGLADWDKIKAVKSAVKVPVFANGNILSSRDVERCLEETGVDGIMSAEGNLYNPAVFEPLNRKGASAYRAALPIELLQALDEVDSRYTGCSDAAYYPVTQLARQYLAIVSHLKTRTAPSAIKAHLFKLFKSVFNHDRHLELREELSKMSSCGVGDDEASWEGLLRQYTAITDEMDKHLQEDYAQGTLKRDPCSVISELDHASVPYSHAQASLRPLTTADAERAAKRHAENLASNDKHLDAGSTDAKKLKLDAAADHDAKVQQILTKCPECNANYSSNRCTRKICKSCCLRKHEEEVAAAADAASAAAREGGANGDGDSSTAGTHVQPVCEEHLSKFKKEQEKKARAKAQKEARKQQQKELREKQRKGKGNAKDKGESGDVEPVQYSAEVSVSA